MLKTRNIPFSPPDISEDEILGVIETLKSGWITTGPKTKAFEKKITEYIGIDTAVCLNSATAAMELSLRILGIGPGDEVITSAYTYTASASVISHVGAKIVLIDTFPDSYEMDYNLMAEAINENTKMIIPVDIAGVMCDYENIFEIVEKKKHLFNPNNKMQENISRVIIMADAAHSFGAKRNNIISGKAADITCFSFHAVKNLTTAEGGAVVWKNSFGLTNTEMYKEFMLYSLHGQSKDALAKNNLGQWEYDIVKLGYKYNMTDILASIGLSQLLKYNSFLEKRFRNIELYNSLLGSKNIEIIKHKGINYSSSGHLLLIRIKNITEIQRNEKIKRLAEVGIASNVHYKPLPMHTAYKKLGFKISDFPNSYNMYRNCISLPLHTLLEIEDIEYISRELLKII